MRSRINAFIGIGLLLLTACSKDNTLPPAEEPDYFHLLFEEYSKRACAIYATIDREALKLENNAWNAGSLPPDSFSQCIYSYDEDDIQLLGWQWQYPEDAHGVNAYPQLIYGWKPWQPASTTRELPVRIGDLSQFKVDYEVEVERNSGDYNLAFDNWINASGAITPQNIQFEFMIWEDAHNMIPFGDFQEEVVTSNGTYRFYMGEPTWEPPGSNWTYLAFERIGNRNKGTVDIDELLDYLIEKGIVSTESFLASIELGNEVGNSAGRTLVKRFEVRMQQ